MENELLNHEKHTEGNIDVSVDSIIKHDVFVFRSSGISANQRWVASTVYVEMKEYKSIVDNRKCFANLSDMS